MNITNTIRATLVAAATFVAAPAMAITVDLGFSIDGSGSIFGSDFVLQRDGLAAALSNIPTSGDVDYRIAVTQFAGGSATTIVEPTVVTAGNLATIQSTIVAEQQRRGGTPLATAINGLVDLFDAAGGLNETALFNISTDGSPNSQSASSAAAVAAFDAGVDGLSFEAVGPGANTTFLASIAGPNGGVIVDLDNIPDPTQQGFVIEVDGFDEFGAAISAKVGEIVDSTGGGVPTGPSPIPLPAGLPLLLTGLLGFFGLRTRQRLAA